MATNSNRNVRLATQPMTLAETIAAAERHEAEAKRLKAIATAEARARLRAAGEWGVPTWERIRRQFGEQE